MGLNVYEDLGYENADEMLRKAELTYELERVIKEFSLSAETAARLLEVPLDDLRGILRGRFRDVEVATISEYLIRLRGSA